MSILEKIKGGLIVSCQALPNEPMHSAFIMGRFAKAAEEGGAVGIRANTVIDIAEIKKNTDLPIIGLIKKEYADSSVYITPTISEAKELVKAGVDIIALDATKRARPNGETLTDIVKELKKTFSGLLMADIDGIEEAKNAQKLGFDLIGTTLRGYTENTNKILLPDFDFIELLVKTLSVPIVAEGGINTPNELKKAIGCGAYCAVVGGAITRPQNITRRFAECLI